MTRRIRLVFCLTVAAISVSISLFVWSLPDQAVIQLTIPTDDLTPIPLEEVVTDVGRYKIGDDRFLDIQRREANETVIRLFTLPKPGNQIFETDWTFHTGTRFNEQWFVAADQYNRIWIYVGASTLGREIPSVYIDGYSFDSNDKLCRMTQEVSRTGTWDGVPQTFLSKIHESPNAFSYSVPRVAPSLPEHKQIQLANITKNRR